jgi:hypothetical protein
MDFRYVVNMRLGGVEVEIHHRGAEDAEIARRLEYHSPLRRILCALCVSVVSLNAMDTQSFKLTHCWIANRLDIYCSRPT